MSAICDVCRRLLRAALKAHTNGILSTKRGLWLSDVADVRMGAERGCPICHWISSSTREMRDPTTNSLPTSIAIDCHVPLATGRYIGSLDEESELWVKFTCTAASLGDASGLSSDALRLGLQVSTDVLFQPSDDEAAGAQKLLDSNTGSADSFTLAHEWLRTCSASHAECQAQHQSGWIPTRLVQVTKPSEGTYSARLRDTLVERLDPSTSYLTLSHRWSAEDTCLLQRSSVEALRECIRFDDLKKSVQDAVVITAELGYHFLWVDTLCIVQDDDEDKAREIVQMHQIYGNSACTIAASYATGVDEGCFVDRDPSPASRYVVEMDFGCDSRCTTHALRRSWTGSGSSAHALGPLTYRGWCFQERVLSPRNLFYSDTQIHWECFELEASEAFPEGALFSDLRPTAPGHVLFHHAANSGADGIWQTWSHLVRDYTRCKLTVQSDRLAGMAGVSALCQKLYQGEDYLWGHWRQTLPVSLLWGNNWKGSGTTPDARSPERLLNIAPSWSWASVTGAAILPERGLAEHDRLLVKLISAPLGNNLVHGNSEAVALGARSLCLRASVWQDTVLHCSNKSRRARVLSRARQLILRRHHYSVVDWYCFQDHKCDPRRWPKDNPDNAICLDLPSSTPMKMTCMPIAEVLGGLARSSGDRTLYERGLILVEQPGGAGPIYQRIGTYALDVRDVPKHRTLSSPQDVYIA